MYMYKYHYLYKITNKYNGKYYYGIHSTNDLNDGYMGSGKTLLKAYKKYGKESFIKEYIEFFDNRTDLLNAEHEIVNEKLITDNNCYNIIPGGKQVEAIYELYKTKKLVRYNNGNEFFYVDKDDPRLKTGELLPYCIGRNKNKVTVRDNNNNCFMVSLDDPRYLSGELKHIATGKNKNKVVVIDKDGNIFQVSKDDSRYLSGELKFILGYSNKGKVTVKDKDGNRFRVNVNDPRYLSGELVQSTTGKIYIHKENIVKVVYTIEDLNTHLLNGWVKGIGNNRKSRKQKSKL